jgi:hypothetical protein
MTTYQRKIVLLDDVLRFVVFRRGQSGECFLFSFGSLLCQMLDQRRIHTIVEIHLV